MEKNNELTFTLFGDFHYNDGVWPTRVCHLETILNSALEKKSDFVLHTGDFCMDYLRSPEIVNKYLGFELPVYGVMGNHELEQPGNTVDIVTPKLTNSEVHWGTEDEQVGDGYIAYYWFEKNGFRFVCTDTNYSFNPETNEWERNVSFVSRKGNLYRSSLGTKQLEWLEKVLMDAAEKKIPCIVVSHTHFHPTWDLWPDPSLRAADSDKVRAIFKKVNEFQKGTIIMAINGHVHSNRVEIVDNILHLDVISPLIGWWKRSETDHYKPEHKITIDRYDDEGNYLLTEDICAGDLSQGKQSNFYEKPLYTTVKISGNHISVEPMESNWLYGILPTDVPEEMEKYGYPSFAISAPWCNAKITGGEFDIER